MTEKTTQDQAAIEAAKAQAAAEKQRLADEKKAAKAAEAKAKAEAKAAEAKAKADAKAAEKAAKEAAKEAAKAEKEAAKAAKAAQKQVVQNDVTRPKEASSCGKIWAIADQLSAKHKAPVTIKQLEEIALAEGFNPATIKTQYARWRKFHGVTGRVVTVEAKADTAVETPAE